MIPAVRGESQTREANSVIPAVRGEFYAYSAEFTSGTCCGFLMKCKANKNQPLHVAEEYPHELDLVFVFGISGVTLCSPDSEACARLFAFGGQVDFDDLHETQIGFPKISEKAFYRLCEKKDEANLIRICSVAIEERSEPLATLTVGTILAVRTSTGKYGLLLIKEITDDSVKVDACHILS